MNEILKRRMADMTLLEVMEASNLVEISKSLTLSVDELCKVLKKPRRRIYALIDNRILPEELVVGGYESRKQNNKILFHTHKVIEWLKL
ncbi:MAG: hypothetical protein RSH24_01315 [Flavobacterium sp.]